MGAVAGAGYRTAGPGADCVCTGCVLYACGGLCDQRLCRSQNRRPCEAHAVASISQRRGQRERGQMAVCHPRPDLVCAGVNHEPDDHSVVAWWTGAGVDLSVYEALYPSASGGAGGGLWLVDSDGMGGGERIGSAGVLAAIFCQSGVDGGLRYAICHGRS